MTAPRAPAGGRRLDERAFHAWLARALPWGRVGTLPLGDDAAALRAPPGTQAIVSTDALVEGTHFVRGSSPGAVGAAATAVSLSDLAAKGAAPAAVLLALILPPRTPARWAERLVLGAERRASAFGAHVVGGDTKSGPRPAVVSVALGWTRAPVGRSGARAGDRLVTTGVVGRGGAAALGLRATGPARLRAGQRLLRVTPRVREGRALARHAHAMLDTSDGIAESVRLLAAASRVRAVLDEERLPLAAGLRRLRPGPRRAAAFYGGDYELLAAVPPGRLAAAVRAVRSVGGRLTAVGHVEPGRGAVLAAAAGRRPMPRAGWDPFGVAAGGLSRRPVPGYRRAHATFK